jgi:SAM-dependent methyltransferase
MRLNVGCGEFRQDGWVNIDVTRNDSVQPDIIAHATDLPFEDGSVARVYMGHVLEHLTKDNAIVALREVRRVLEPGGRLCVVGPDIELALHLFPTDTKLHAEIRAGGGRWPGDAHLWDSTGQETACLAIQSGWMMTEPCQIQHVPPEWPVVSRVGWQFGMLATKERT